MAYIIESFYSMLFLILDGSDAWMLRATHVVWVLVVTVVGWGGQSTDWQA